MKKSYFIIINFFFISFLFPVITFSQIRWTNVDSLFQPMPQSVHVFFTGDKIDTANFRAYYVEADLKDKNLDFTIDTTLNRRLTPIDFYKRNGQPLVVSNCSFFSFQSNRNVNVLVQKGKMIAYDTEFVKGKGKDSLLRFFTLRSAIGINKNRKADIVWTAADSTMKFPVAFESPRNPLAIDPAFKKTRGYMRDKLIKNYLKKNTSGRIRKWKMKTVIGGGPVLIQNGEVRISNNEEMMFAGKAIIDKHPRTAMGYTHSGKLILLVIEGRSLNAAGADLKQVAQILKDLGCWEALNLDGGGSSYMLVNGKQTISPSDREGQRRVPSVFMIRQKQ